MSNTLDKVIAEVMTAVRDILNPSTDLALDLHGSYNLIDALKLARKLNMSLDQVVLTLEDYGNTSAATVPTALDTAIRDGRIKRGQNLLLEAFGGGFAWASALVRY